ncbi:MAG TPA: D-serine ammonia-lyase [Bacillales bacterium]|nr:D-serine ammonia-lyase [Bacillales bacterium]
MVGLNERFLFGRTKQQWLNKLPLLKQIVNLEPVFWENRFERKMGLMKDLPVTFEDMKEADARFRRFEPFFEAAFPETRQNHGSIESPLRIIPKMKKQLEAQYGHPIEGSLYLKGDYELPIAGSVKARGGIYEVLKHAEDLALQHRMLSINDSYARFASPAFQSFFSNYSIAVGSTGNLGLSIGMIGTKLGFHVDVYMSKDAKQWKKDLLREKGAVVHEFESDFSKAVAAGRGKSAENPNSYFVDDEDSRDLFLGYSVAAFHLRKQLELKRINVDRDHPLFVYLPCGVGGAPGGITFGLKQLFGRHVHCFFVEPTHAPSSLLGMLTGTHHKVSVQDFGIAVHTEADGLAVGTPSRFATPINETLVSGIFTVEDDELFKMLTLVFDTERVKLEPSACASLYAAARLMEESDYLRKQGLTSERMANATHIAWATGGALVPGREMNRFYEKGKNLLF